jgi:hypothetical protein
MAVIPLKCKCGKRLTASIKFIGEIVRCTQCAARLKVPAIKTPAASTVGQASSPTQSAGAKVVCRCGQHLKIGLQLAGKTVRCPACHATFKIPS